MEEFTLRLNNFLFNSGILGFYRVLHNAEKNDLMEIQGNCLIVKKSAIDNFEEDYINAMIDTYEEGTKWYTIVSLKEIVRQIDEDSKQLESIYTQIKKAIESASYKSAYESIEKNSEENIYEILKSIKAENDFETKKKLIVKIIEHLEKNKKVYCMKDIIYTKINCFWENVSFLNRSANKKDIKEEYKKTFVSPVQSYLNQSKKSDYRCIECGNEVSKSEASGMSWLKDIGVDMNRKKSGFWNFNEDMFLCPICNLIYSCVPLGFYMVGSNGIFINNNDSFMALKRDNQINNRDEKISLEGAFHRTIYNYINRMSQIGNEKKAKFEPKNIQVIKRIGSKDNQYYEFNILSKDKLEILKKASNQFECLVNSNIYQEVLANLIYNQKQYNLIARLLKQKYELNYIKPILNIEAINIEGGRKMEDRKELIDDAIEAGETLQKYFFVKKENGNKLKAYEYRLQNALKANRIEEFLKQFTMFYGSLKDFPMPNGKGILKLIEDPDYFRLLGYSYVYGLGKKIKGGNENEE